MSKSYKEIMPQIKTFIFDVDGVLTDGMLHLDHEGRLLRTMNAKDGFALKIALDKGYNVCIITGGNESSVKDRLRGLGITDIYMNSLYKLEPFEEYIDVYGLNASEVAYMGDDVPDLEVLKKVGLATCPKDASPQVQQIADYVSSKNGGGGCVRDLIEQVLRVQGNWPASWS